MYGVEYWSARDLMPLLGYKRWDRFVEAIKDAIISLQQNEQVGENHISRVGKKVQLGSGAEREVEDYALSRLGCYIVAQNGDPRKAEIAAAQAYFAISTRSHEMHQLLKQQEERLEARLQVVEGNKKLADAAMAAGVQSQNFGVFNDAGYLGLYTMTSEEIRVHKNISEGEEILDNMGREELAANYFRITQTESKLAREQVQGEDQAIHTHYGVGHEIRKTIEALHAPLPEDLPPAPSIRKMVEDRQKAAKKRKLKAKDQGQDTLF